jgi:outer membrane receptor protein involved in Fe transport
MMRSFRLPGGLAALIVGALFILVPGREANAQTVTGTIFGKVADSSGGVLPGVTVTVTSPQLIGGAQTRVTSATGEYRVPALPPGTYEATFELSGFRGIVRSDIVLEAGATIPVDATLDVASVAETVTVNAAQSTIDTKSAQTREMATKDIIENIPTPGRTFVEVLDLLPGVTDGGYNVATTGTNSVNGGGDRENSFTIDGVNLNDPLVAYPATDLSLDLIQEVQVTTSGMSAEFGSASGAVFNVITKSGSNTLHGQVSDYYRGKSLQSTNITPELKAQGIKVGTQLTKDNEASGTLGGPLLRDRLWYFGNYQRIDQDQTLIAFPPTIQATQDAAFLKVTNQLSPANKLEGFYQYRLRYDYPFQPELTLGDPSVYRKQRQSNNTINVKWTSVLTDRTFLEARGSIANQRRFTDFSNAGPNSYGYIDEVTNISTGGWFRDLAQPGNRNTRQVKVDLTHFASNWGYGSHDLKMGGSYDWLIDQEVRNWRAGAMVMLMLNGVPDRVRLGNSPVDQNGNVDQFSAYVQDQWSVNNRLTLNLGVRAESLRGGYPKGGAGGVNFPRVEFPAKRDLVTFKNVAPRLGAAYDVSGDHRTVVRATFGRYYNQLYVGEFGAAIPYAFGSKTYTWSDVNGDLIYQPGEERTLISDSTVPAQGRIDPDVKQSYVQATTVGIERQLSSNLSASASVIIKDEHDLAEVINPALPFDTAYVPVTLTNPVTGAPITIYAQNPSTRGIPTVNLYTNPGRATCSFCPDLTRRYRGLQLTMTKRMSNRWQLLGSYVYARGEGNKGNDHDGSQGNVFGNPNTLVNADGDLTLDRTHQFKLQGTYEMPWDVVVSASYSAISGLPWAPQVRFTKANSPLIVVESGITVKAEPLGSERYDVDQDLSLRGERRFKFGTRTLGLMVDVFNVLNLSTVTSYQQTRIDLAGYQKAGAILPPRTFRLGARFSF